MTLLFSLIYNLTRKYEMSVSVPQVKTMNLALRLSFSSSCVSKFRITPVGSL